MEQHREFLKMLPSRQLNATEVTIIVTKKTAGISPISEIAAVGKTEEQLKEAGIKYSLLGFNGMDHLILVPDSLLTNLTLRLTESASRS